MVKPRPDTGESKSRIPAELSSKLDELLSGTELSKSIEYGDTE